MSHGHVGEIKDPGRFQIPSGLKSILLIFAVVGVVVFVMGLLTDPTRAWSSFIINHFYFMSLCLGGLFFAAIQWLTGAMWSAPIRRICESFTAYLPIVLITLVILFFGIHDLYHWSHPEAVKGDMILEGKAGYLSTPFFIVRNLIAVGLWFFFAKKLVSRSIAQDETKDYELTLKNQKWTPAFLIIFALTFTLTSFDQLMSLDPHWFSTMFGVYCFAGLFYSSLAALCLVTIYLKRKGYLVGIVNDHHLHDIGKFMFAFTIFWAYIGFSQFMLIWYANLPEETGYYLRRLDQGWLGVSIFLLVGKFLVPFFLLLPRGAKRQEARLIFVGIFMLVAQWIDMMWMVQPEFFKEGPRVGLIEIGMTIGFIGLFGTMVTRFLAKHRVVAIGDPRLPEAVFHHHQ